MRAPAFGIANKCGLSPEEFKAQEQREIFIQDQRGVIMFAEQQVEQQVEQRERLRSTESFLDLIESKMR